MPQTSPDTLGLSRVSLRLLIKLNWFVGVLLLALLVISVANTSWMMEALKTHPAKNMSTFVMALRSIVIVGLLTIPLAHIVLTRLLAIVDTVRVGDPFVAENAARLQTIAWTVLAMEVLHLVVGGIIATVQAAGEKFDMDWDFSLTRWLVILLLFVLARVFEQGARMRDDLEGTV